MTSASNPESNEPVEVPVIGHQVSPRFERSDEFEADLRKVVDGYFQEAGISTRDRLSMVLKTIVLLGLAGMSYWTLLFVALPAGAVVALVVFLALVVAGIGFNVQHDGGHHAYSRHAWINRLAAASLDLIGASSYVWRWKHDVLHHMFVNIAGHDTDIDLGPFGRVSPDHPRRTMHRFQHLYIWPLYGILALKWQWFDDFRDVLVGRLGARRMPRPKGWDLALFLLGRLAFFGWTIGIPSLFHPLGSVIACYVLGSVVLGIVLSVVFQLAHAVGEAQFPSPDPVTGKLDSAWARHQVRTTVDFSRGNAFVTWCLGGLNYQIEHHLFPRISHVHYPALAPLVESVCLRHGVAYHDHGGFWKGIASHYRWLRHMGSPAQAS
ncbi:MAG: fatty acid desaturase [Fibrobacteres bacterium]|nr:fatty acid desaturase [Fibrobacterota bacterium]